MNETLTLNGSERILLEAKDNLAARYTLAPGLRARVGRAFAVYVMVDPSLREFKAGLLLPMSVCLSASFGARIDNIATTTALALKIVTLTEPYLFAGGIFAMKGPNDFIYEPLLNHALAAGVTVHFSAGRDREEFSLEQPVPRGGPHPNELRVTLCFVPTGIASTLIFRPTTPGDDSLLRQYFTYEGEE